MGELRRGDPLRLTAIRGDADLAAIGVLFADRARCRILLALSDGRTLPASQLATKAGISPATASSHLAKLTKAGLLTVEAIGRHRMYRIARPEVSTLIDALKRFATATAI
jgi:DNA-binding transcriptional ArsR family regulator